MSEGRPKRTVRSLGYDEREFTRKLNEALKGGYYYKRAKVREAEEEAEEEESEEGADEESEEDLK